MKKNITFEQLKKLVKEAVTSASTYNDPESGLEFESKELVDITPINDTDAWTVLADACMPVNLFAPDEDMVEGGVFTADYFEQQYNTLLEMADLLGGSSNAALKECAEKIRTVVKPYAEKLKAYMADASAKQTASDAMKQKRREQYLKLRDEFKDEEI